jgi:A/G-specific adenine glycosylase
VTNKKFKQTIWKYYKTHKRSFPWRETKDPYRIWISEIMLQQTQTDRVRAKYAEWLKKFPTVSILARAPLKEVLQTWQGLGYNRRALAVKRAAEIIVEKYNKQFPKNYSEILDLPGIGPYTAGAIMAFAFNKPVAIVETNIRTVFIHEYFKDHGQVHDSEILKLVEKTLDTKNPREWYYALMDYGVMLKKTIGNANKRSKHYAQQNTFKGSNREIRSAILRSILELKTRAAIKDIQSYLQAYQIQATKDQITRNVEDLEREGFIVRNKNKFLVV